MKTLLVVIGITVAASTAHANVAEARRFFSRGNVAYNLQHFAEALDEFEHAYREEPDPAFLFNIGQCERQLGRYDAAAKSYAAYLSSSSPAPANEAQVRALIPQMQQRAAAETRPAELAPTSPAAAVAPASAPERARWYRSRPLGWGIASAGLALVIAGAVTLGIGEHDHSAAGRATSLASDKQLVHDSNTLETTSIPLLTIGGVALAGGIAVVAVAR